MKKKLQLNDVRFEHQFSMNKDTTIFTYLRDAVTGKYGKTLDFDMYLPSRGKNLQRELVWTLFQKQQLILSVLKGIRIPSITVLVLDYKHYQIVDGKQRLNALISYGNGEFPVIVNDEEYYIDDLDEWARRAVEMMSIVGDIIYEYDDTRMTDDQKIALYEMINFAGTPQDAEHINNLKIK
jgi:hypothetical protein